MLKKAKQAYQNEKFEDALYFAQKVEPMNAQSFVCAAKSAVALNRYDLAKTLYLKAGTANPTVPLIWKVRFIAIVVGCKTALIKCIVF